MTKQEIELFFEQLQTRTQDNSYAVLNGNNNDHIHAGLTWMYNENDELEGTQINFTYNDSIISEQRCTELLENADTVEILTQQEMDKRTGNAQTFNVTTPTWSRVMSGEELKNYLDSLGIKQNHGYFILCESDNAAVGINPTAPSPFVVWEKTQDGGYVNGLYGNSLNRYNTADLRNLGIEKSDVIDALRDVGVMYTNEQAGVNTPTWSRIMSNDELVTHLDSLGLERHDGYFILSENDTSAFAFNPSAGSEPYVQWDKTADGEYINPVSSQNIEDHITSYQRGSGAEISNALKTLRESGVLYTNRRFDESVISSNESVVSNANIPTANRSESNNEASQPLQPQAEVPTPPSTKLQSETATTPTTPENQEVTPMAAQSTKFATDEQKQLAKQVDLLSYLHQNGYEVKPHGSEYKVAIDGHDSVVIFPQGNSWFDFNRQVGGDSISFLMQNEQLNFVDSVHKLLGDAGNFRNMHIAAESDRQVKPKEPLVLPDRAENENRVYAYLVKTRGIDRDIVHDSIARGDIYQSKKVVQKGEDEYTFNNCVFVGKDENGTAQYASQRSLNDQSNHVYKGDANNSSKEYGFCIPGGDDAKWLTVCEAPIDALSVATLNKRNEQNQNNEHILSLGGVSDKAIDKFLETHPGIEVINVCLDNDTAGRAAGERIKEKYAERGLTIIDSYPKEKDYNAQLIADVAKENAPHLDMPSAAADNKRSYMHLTATKQISQDVVKESLNSGDAYQVNKQQRNGNKSISETMFTRRDEHGNPTYAISVSHNYNIEKSDFKVEYKDDSRADNYLSSEGKSDTLVVYSNPISMLTGRTIEQDIARLAAEKGRPAPKSEHMICCLSGHSDAVKHYLGEHPNIKEVKVSLDKSISVNPSTSQTFDYRQASMKNIKRGNESKDVKVTEKFPKNNNLNQDYVGVRNNAQQKNNEKSVIGNEKSKLSEHEM